MANQRKHDKDATDPAEPSVALNAICPYYTMFPLEFPISVIGKTRHKKKLRILDPFCGRGTTIFAARLLGHQAYGIDCSPIAIAIARAKLAETGEPDVISLAKDILKKQTNATVPAGEFWEWAYAPETLKEVCILRDGLDGLRSDAANILRAVCLGALHGPLTKSVATRSYFSNQMPRTFASKPDYSVRYWKAKELRPVAVDVLKIIKARVERLQLDKLPKCTRTSKVSVGDSRLTRGYGAIDRKVDLVITSPPYYGMTTYVADQWLRNWFLGGSADVPYGERNPLSHRSPQEFAESLARVWNRVGDRLSTGGKLFVRFGAIPSRKSNPREIMQSSLDASTFSWKVRCICEAKSAAEGKRQASHMGKRVKSDAIVEYDYEIAL